MPFKPNHPFGVVGKTIADTFVLTALIIVDEFLFSFLTNLGNPYFCRFFDSFISTINAFFHLYFSNNAKLLYFNILQPFEHYFCLLGHTFPCNPSFIGKKKSGYLPDFLNYNVSIRPIHLDLSLHSVLVCIKNNKWIQISNTAPKQNARHT